MIPFRPADPSFVVKSHDPHDRKLGEDIRPAMLENVPEKTFVLLGFPSDEGVVRNGGRPGAGLGPAEIRRHLYRLQSPFWHRDAMRNPVCDIGDLACEGNDLEAWQEQLGEAVATLLARNCFPIILGGGHETTFGHYLGYEKAGIDASCINIDAHHDLRDQPRATSGNSFRRMLDRMKFEAPNRYQIIGLQRDLVSDHYRNYLQVELWGAARAIERDRITLANAADQTQIALAGLQTRFFLSLDLDVLDQAFAPGVSAPATLGLTPMELDAILDTLFFDDEDRLMGFDVVELCPPQDRDGQTARIAARVIHKLLHELVHPERRPDLA